jgi:hypothetical protein
MAMKKNASFDGISKLRPEEKKGGNNLNEQQKAQIVKVALKRQEKRPLAPPEK